MAAFTSSKSSSNNMRNTKPTIVKKAPTSLAKKKKQQATKKAIIQTLRPHDILCGRCKTAFNHVGNRRFRVTISMKLQAYTTAYTKAQKSELIGSITKVVQEDVGARFLRPAKGGGYEELGKRDARQKVGHALRDMAVARQQHQQSTTITTTTMAEQRQQQQETLQQQQQQQQQQAQRQVQQQPDHVIVLDELDNEDDVEPLKVFQEDEDEVSLSSCLESLISTLTDDDDESEDFEPLPLYVTI